VGSTMTRKDSYFETPADIMKDGSEGFSQPQSMCMCVPFNADDGFSSGFCNGFTISKTSIESIYYCLGKYVLL
jgi:hypothetical protein